MLSRFDICCQAILLCLLPPTLDMTRHESIEWFPSDFPLDARFISGTHALIRHSPTTLSQTTFSLCYLSGLC